MATVTTTAAINLEQLSIELGSAALSMDDYGNERVICSDSVTQSDLEQAVATHVPGPVIIDETPPPPSPASLLQAQVDELTDLVFSLMEGP